MAAQHVLWEGAFCLNKN
jgi:hypothetical protein